MKLAVFLMSNIVATFDISQADLKTGLGAPKVYFLALSHRLKTFFFCSLSIVEFPKLIHCDIIFLVMVM